MINAVVLGSAGVLKPGKLRWLRALLWGVLLLCLTFVLPQFAIGIGLALLGGVSVLEYRERPMDFILAVDPGVLLGVTAVCVLLAIGIYGAMIMLGEKRQPSELELRPAPIELAAGLAIGAAMMTVAVGLMWAAGGIVIDTDPVRDPSRALAFTLQSGVLEEVAFRLIVLRLLWRAFGLELALLLSALLFGIVHVSNPNAGWFAALAIAIEAGIMLAGFYILTGRVWAPIGVHAGWNFSQGWLFGAPVSGFSFFAGGPIDVEPARGASEILTGGGFGPEASFAGLLVGTAVGALTFWLAWKRGRLRGLSEAERPQASQSPEA